MAQTWLARGRSLHAGDRRPTRRRSARDRRRDRPVGHADSEGQARFQLLVPHRIRDARRPAVDIDPLRREGAASRLRTRTQQFHLRRRSSAMRMIASPSACREISAGQLAPASALRLLPGGLASLRPARRGGTTSGDGTSRPSNTSGAEHETRGRFLIATLCGLVIAAGVHIVAILASPRFAEQDAFGRVQSTLTADTRADHQRAGGANTWLPLPDPAVAVAACAFDLRDGPMRVAAKTGSLILSFRFHTKTGGVVLRRHRPRRRARRTRDRGHDGRASSTKHARRRTRTSPPATCGSSLPSGRASSSCASRPRSRACAPKPKRRPRPSPARRTRTLRADALAAHDRTGPGQGAGLGGCDPS